MLPATLLEVLTLFEITNMAGLLVPVSQQEYVVELLLYNGAAAPILEIVVSSIFTTTKA